MQADAALIIAGTGFVTKVLAMFLVPTRSTSHVSRNKVVRTIARTAFPVNISEFAGNAPTFTQLSRQLCHPFQLLRQTDRFEIIVAYGKAPRIGAKPRPGGRVIQ